jgi:hypothetical protein
MRRYRKSASQKYVNCEEIDRVTLYVGWHFGGDVLWTGQKVDHFGDCWICG